MPTYLAVGHVTIDRFEEGDRPGGSILHAGAQARKLGWATRIVTSAVPESWPVGCLRQAGHEVTCLESETTSTFEYTWPAGRRMQRLTAVAAPIMRGAVPRSWLDSDIWHLAPVAGELDPAMVDTIPPTAFVGVTPQGWMRRVDERNIVRHQPWSPSHRLLTRTNAMVLSRQDMAGADESARGWSEAGVVVAVTAAAGGAWIYDHGKATRLPPFSVIALNELGAGDVFAAAFFDHLHGGTSPAAAGTFAGAAAARVVAHEAALPSGRAEIEAFMACNRGLV